MTILIRLIKFPILKQATLGQRIKKHFSSRFILMSTIEKRFSRILPVFAEIFIFALFCSAQKIEANLKIESISPPILNVKGRVLRENAGKNWTFLRSIAGVENLGERIKDLSLTDKSGRAVAVKKFIAGEFLAEESAESFSYRVDLTSFKNISAAAHVSWLSGEQGVLMLDDLLPQFPTSDGQPVSARINFELPIDWKIVGNEAVAGQNSFDVANIEKAIFLVGKNWRESEVAVGENTLKFAISGEWLFSDAEAAQTASEILREYQKIFGAASGEKQQIFLLKFPKETKTGNWEAETRGANVIILSSDMPFKSQSIQRLHEQFRHEFFHLRIPNNLALKGNYDWFYEGFALYQSLRTGVNLNRIRFEDFLDTLGRAFDSDNLQSQKVSLIEASKNRWSGANLQVYARGMLVAFLCDAALLRASRGKRSVTDILRQVYQKYKKPNQPQAEGNAAILSLLNDYAELRPIVERYVKNAEKINWQADLESVGIESNGETFPVKLSVKSKLSGRQRDLLDKLGYNSWRKISEKSK